MEKMKKALDEFISILKEKFGDKIEKIIVFGSYARGEYSEDSDIDVLIVTKEFDISLEKEISAISFKILLKYSVDISPKVYSAREFKERMDSPFMMEIKKHGVAVS